MKTIHTIKLALMLLMVLLIIVDGLLYGQSKKELPSGLQQFYCSGKLEVMGGPNLGWKSKPGEDGGTVKPLPGFGLGVQVDTRIHERIGFRPGIYWELKRSKYSNDYGTDYYLPDFGVSYPGATNGRQAYGGPQQYSSVNLNGENSLDEWNSLNYLSIPLAFSFYFLSSNSKIALLAGLNPGFLIASRARTDIFGNEEVIKGKEDLQLKTFDFAALIGLQYKILQNLGLALVYDHSFTPHYNEYDLKYASRVIKFMVLYTLNFNPFFKESYGPQRRDLEFK